MLHWLLVALALLAHVPTAEAFYNYGPLYSYSYLYLYRYNYNFYYYAPLVYYYPVYYYPYVVSLLV
jgi:hypothetical protein